MNKILKYIQYFLVLVAYCYLSDVNGSILCGRITMVEFQLLQMNTLHEP